MCAEMTHSVSPTTRPLLVPTHNLLALIIPPLLPSPTPSAPSSPQITPTPRRPPNQQDKTSLLTFARPNRVDFVALSFTRSGADVAEARAYLDSMGMSQTKIIAKIENKVGAGVGLRGEGGEVGGWGLGLGF